MSLSPISSTTPESLYEGNYTWLRQWFGRRMGCREDAADLAQDTFVRVLLKAGDLPGIHEPRAYLTVIARGLLKDHWRRRSLEKAWLETLAALPLQVTLSPEERLSMWQTVQRLDYLLAGLAPKAREVFVLSQLEGLSYTEIATRVGVSERTVKRYMAQGFELCLSLME